MFGRATTHVIQVPVNTVDRSTSAGATVTFDDFVITGPGGGPVTVSLNLRLNGSYATNLTIHGCIAGGVSSAMSVSVGGLIDGNAFAGSFSQGRNFGFNPFFCQHGDDVSTNASGILGPGPSFAPNPVSPMFSLPVGTPFQVTLTLSASGSWHAGISGTAGVENTPDFTLEGLSDFGLSFGEGSVFNLPPGYTVNSPDAQVVDNVYVPCDYSFCDANCDGQVDGRDVQSFVNAMLGAPPPQGCSACALDANADGSVTPADTPAFAACLLGA